MKEATRYVYPTVNASNSFDSRDYLDDSSQRVLLPYIQKTQVLLNRAIERHDLNGGAEVIPSFDLGFTYNTARLAGGFTTGMAVNWCTDIPFVPIDMTIKECSGSVVAIDVRDTSFFTADKIKKALVKLRSAGYRFNFKSGNHFISLFRDDEWRYYLVIHSGDDGYRDNAIGVYPSDDVWYKGDVLSVYDDDGGRYLKYLVGAPAEKFINFALDRRHALADFHRLLADELVSNCGRVIASETYRHYGLDSPHTAVLGTGLVYEGGDFPIFSKEGLPIVLARPTGETRYVLIDGERRYVIPHGWGQRIKGVTSLSVSSVEKKISIGIGKESLCYDYGYTVKLPRDIADVREFDNYSDFISGKIPFEACWNDNLIVDVRKILYPVASYRDEEEIILLWR